MSDQKTVEMPGIRLEGFKVYVEMGYNLKFLCEVAEGNEITKDTFRELQTAVTAYAERMEKKRKKARKMTPVPIYYWGRCGAGDPERKAEPALITGVHGGTGNAIVKIDGRKAQQVSSGYDSRQYIKDMGDADVRVLQEMHAAHLAAKRIYLAFLKRFEIENLAKYAEEVIGE